MGLPDLRLLGGFDFRSGSGRPVPIARRKVQALLAYLACHSGQAQPRDKLAALLWPDMEDEQARANLRKALFILRSALTPTAVGLRLVEDAVALDGTALHVDVLAFERRARQGTPQALQQAAELYRGDLLEGLGVSTPPFEEWLTAERERLRELALEALARLLGHQIRADDPGVAVETARRLLALDPLQESVQRALMRLYARHGRRDAALRQYQSCVDTLRRELSTEPETETRQLYQEILRSRARPSDAACTAAAHLAGPAPKAPRHPLPSSDEAPMIGREPELTQLMAALDEAFARRGRVVAVLGEAGIGKSRLVSQVGVEAVKRGALMLVGHAYPTEQALAYGPWIDALRTGGVLERDDALSRVAPAWRAELARLFPELARPEDQPAPRPEDPMRLFEAISHWLEALAQGQPLLLVLEDVHWADEMSVRLTSVLSRRIATSPILIVATAREEDVAEATVLRDLLRLETIVRLPLGPLSQGETTALVQSLGWRGRDPEAEAGLAERIWTASDGNPFVIVETMRAVEQGAPAPSRDALPMPERVRDLIEARLDRLSERGRALVGLAAVIGREFEFDLLQRASGLGEDEAAGAVEELVRRRVLHAVNERFDLVHDRVRQVSYAALLPIRRKLLHRHVAEALEALHAQGLEPHVATLGEHYHAGEVWDKALAYLRQAAAGASAHSAYRRAWALYEQALSALDRISTAQSRIEDAIDLRLALHLPLALLAEYDRIDTTLAEAERLAEALADSERLAAVVGFQAYARFIRADYPRALDLIWRAVAMPRPHPPLPTADLFLGIILYHTGAYHPALTALTEAHAHHRTVLQASTIAFYEVLALIELGDYEAALTRTDRAFRLSEELDHHFSRALATASGGLIALGKGEADTAIHLLERAVGLCVEGQYRVALPYVTAGLGSAYLLAGRAADALEVLHEAVRHGLPTHARCSLSLGEACLHAGRAEEARHLFERSLATAHGNGERGTQARSLWLLGEIAARSEPEITEGTEGRYREALALATELGMRPLVASCHLGLGTLYRRRGKGPDSLEHLSMAAAMYRQMNMRPGLEQAMAELRNAAT